MLFSIFLFLMVFSQLVQQLMPHFVWLRALFEIREGPSRVYNWRVLILSFLIVESTWQTLMAVLAFVAWYFPIGFQKKIPEKAEQHILRVSSNQKFRHIGFLPRIL
jgi:ABC-type multidrug transport system permease subunit